MMAWMRRLAGLFSARGLFLLLGAIAVVLLVWFGGPLIAIAGWEPLATAAARVIFLLLVIMAFMARHLWRSRKQRADNEKVVSEMMAGSQEDELLKEEVDTQRERMRKALALVKKWRPGKFRSVYELPWYMIIGAPGSGKSTALLNSGLEFPLKDEMGIDAVKGVGGTRYCDWWFTNRAVIIDTAGRYTTQESSDKRDSRGWNSFLGLLKKYRSRQPINGVILSVSVADLLEQTPTERMLHARALKQRVQELKNRLGVVFPVYVVLTKFDLLEGFHDTFGMLSEQEREEVFGMTFDLQSVRDPKELPASFDREFDDLIERLSHYLLHRMQQERTPATSRRIYQFPKQVALLRAPLWALMKEVFFPSAYEEVPILRGVYLVSSEQGGKSYDKVSSLVDDQFKLKMPSKKAAAKTAVHDGFFLRHLFDNIIFSEHGLASADGRKEKRFVWFRRAAVAGMTAVTVGLGVAWYMSYQWNDDLIAGYQTDVEGLKEGLANPHQDWIQLDSLLSRAAGLPGVLNSPMPEGGPKKLGLFQGSELGQAAEGAYGRLLQHRFAEDLKETLEMEIDDNLSNLEYLYETLKTYLMLNQHQYMNEDQIYAWFELVLNRQLPGEINSDSRQSLLNHLDNYLALNHVMPIDNERVSIARAELTAMPLDERAYQRIQMDAADSRFPDFRLPMVLGSVADRVFERRSGASLNQGIPALYTINGYKGIFEPEKEKIVGRLLEDSWVYGEEAQDFRDLDEQQIKAGVEDRYFRDYVHHWETYLDDLRIRSINSEREANQVASLIAGPEAPINRLMAAVKFNTELTDEDEGEGVEDKLMDAAGDAAGRAADRATRRGPSLGSLIPSGSSRNGDGPQKTMVDRAFDPVNEVDEDTLESLQSDARLMARYFEEQSSGRPQALQTVSRGDFDEAVKSFYSTVNNAKAGTLERMLGGFVNDSRRMVKTSVTNEINAVWRDRVFAEYRSAIAGNYPFRRGASSDVALNDFASFFGYGGTLDQFFDEYLAGHVDTSRSPWRLTGDVTISRGSLRALENAQRIREAFFSPGSRQPKVSFDLQPDHLDQDIARLMLEVDSQTLTYSHGPARTFTFNWPEESGARRARIAMTPVDRSGSTPQQSYNGPWAVFRLLQDAGGMNGGGREQKLEISLNGHSATLDMTTDSVRHPFNSAMLEDFRLPSSL